MVTIEILQMIIRVVLGNDTVRADSEGCDEDGGDENRSFDDDDEKDDESPDDDHDVAYELGDGTGELNNVMVLVVITRTTF